MRDLTKLKGYSIISEFVTILENAVRKESVKDFLSLSVKNMLFVLGLLTTREQEKLIEVYISCI